MRKGYYGDEPFDLRLTVLRMLRMLPFIAAVTLMGTILFGGGYYVKNVLLRGPKQYAVTSVYRVEYDVEEEKDVGSVYINQVSWNTYLHSELFLDAMEKELAETGGMVEEEALKAATEAYLASDLRVPSTTVTTESPEESIRIAKAVEAAMTGEPVGEIREILSVSVIDPGDSAVEVIPDVRPLRACILSAVLSCFFAVILLLLAETGDDSIHLPATLWRRYGLKTVGTLRSRELSENLKYFFRKRNPENEPDRIRRIAVCGVQESIEPEKVLKGIREICPEAMGAAETEWFTAPSPLTAPEICETLREADGILLAVKAGRHAGRPLEHVSEYLEQQDCPVTAAILWEADERLIRWYYAMATGKAESAKGSRMAAGKSGSAGNRRE